MWLSECQKLRELVSELGMRDFDELHKKIRMEARENINKLQYENKKAFDLKRKQERTYNVNDLFYHKENAIWSWTEIKRKVNRTIRS